VSRKSDIVGQVVFLADAQQLCATEPPEKSGGWRGKKMVRKVTPEVAALPTLPKKSRQCNRPPGKGVDMGLAIILFPRSRCLSP